MNRAREAREVPSMEGTKEGRRLHPDKVADAPPTITNPEVRTRKVARRSLRINRGGVMCRSDRVATLAAAMVLAEGEYTVGGRYYASAEDAAKARLIEAERRARAEAAAELRRALLATRFEVTEAGRAALHAGREWRRLRDALQLLVDERECWIDDHGVCRTHDEPCTHERGVFECPVALARRALARQRMAS